mmetsp:Transcript_170449/g.546559  ORF Transcript_170449/g.546559 Transcript_170449/m.546559 type:complete len:215 (-) Transcript_170449:879-1523(-)
MGCAASSHARIWQNSATPRSDRPWRRSGTRRPRRRCPISACPDQACSPTRAPRAGSAAAAAAPAAASRPAAAPAARPSGGAPRTLPARAAAARSRPPGARRSRRLSGLRRTRRRRSRGTVRTASCPATPMSRWPRASLQGPCATAPRTRVAPPASPPARQRHRCGRRRRGPRRAPIARGQHKQRICWRRFSENRRQQRRRRSRRLCPSRPAETS